MRGELVVIAGAALATLSSAGCHMGLAGFIMGAREAQPPYESGAIAGELGRRAVRTLACLDIGLSIRERQPLLEMDVGNRCAHAEPFDLGRIVIRATDEDGAERAVSLVDPRGEIVRIHIGPQERGHERIRLGGLGDAAHLCFDLAAVATDAPDARPAPICLDQDAGTWRARGTP